MKILYTLFLNLFMFSIFCQNVPINFETNGNGTNWTWTTFENDYNPALEIVPNPDPSGINFSSTVAKFTALQAGNPWAGFESMHGSDIGSFSLDSTNCIIKIMVWKSVISDVGIKLVDVNSAAQPEIKVANTLINRWEELTFDFSSRIGVYPIVKDQIVIFPDFDLTGRTQDNIIYIDNIYDLDMGTSSIENQREGLIKLYPNPSLNEIKFSVNEKFLTNELTISNQIGKIIKKELLLNTTTIIDISSYSSGIYFFQIEGNKKILKFVKL